MKLETIVEIGLTLILTVIAIAAFFAIRIEWRLRRDQIICERCGRFTGYLRSYAPPPVPCWCVVCRSEQARIKLGKAPCPSDARAKRKAAR